MKPRALVWILLLGSALASQHASAAPDQNSLGNLDALGLQLSIVALICASALISHSRRLAQVRAQRAWLLVILGVAPRARILAIQTMTDLSVMLEVFCTVPLAFLIIRCGINQILAANRYLFRLLLHFAPACLANRYSSNWSFWGA